MIHVGFTGTQRGMTPPQRAAVMRLLRGMAGLHILHHGDCIGADAEAHAGALALGWSIVVHPPIVVAKRAWCTGPSCEVLPPAPYLTRNQHIVDASLLVIATPGEPVEQLRSGTWATIRYARRQRKQVMIVPPDGAIATGAVEALEIDGDEGDLERLARMLSEE